MVGKLHRCVRSCHAKQGVTWRRILGLAVGSQLAQASQDPTEREI